MSCRASLIGFAFTVLATSGGLAASQQPQRLDASTALAVLDSARSHGLNPADYDAAGLRAERDRLNSGVTSDVNSNQDAARAFESRLVTSLLNLGHDVSVGRTQPSAIDRRWINQRTPPDVEESLDAAIAGGTLGSWLQSIEPPHPEYAALRRWLEDPNRTAPEPMSLAEAEQIVAANLERWRWMPDLFGERHVYVNIPSATLVARDGSVDTITMKVVVGKPVNKTPVLSSAINSVVFSPYWNIPESIVSKEILPATRRDPDYLQKHNIDLIRAGGRDLYRQRSGPSNALGLVKFVFPNDFGVYLHDTPTESAFARDARALSHGCVRLEQPASLAEWVLKGVGDWTPPAIDAAMNGGAERWVRLDTPIPVHIAYFTVTSDAGGALSFWRDIYGFDRRQRH